MCVCSVWRKQGGVRPRATGLMNRESSICYLESLGLFFQTIKISELVHSFAKYLLSRVQDAVSYSG